MPNRFSVYELSKRWFETQNIALWAQPQATSTNDIAKAEAFEIPNPLKVYLADQQTQGRGRSGRTWISPATGTSLLITYSFHLDQAPQAIAAPLVGLSLYTSLARAFPQADLSIKPPNDIYLGTKKILGILVEGVQQSHSHRLVVGWGLNVFDHPSSVPEAGHLSATCSVDINPWERLLKEFHGELLSVVLRVKLAHINNDDRDQLLQALNRCPLKKSEYVSISPFGDLQTDDGVRSWRDL